MTAAILPAEWKGPNAECKCKRCKVARGEKAAGYAKHWEKYGGSKREVVLVTDAIRLLRERVWSAVPSIDRTSSFGRRLVTTVVDGRVEWIELDTFSEAELTALAVYYETAPVVPDEDE